MNPSSLLSDLLLPLVKALVLNSNEVRVEVSEKTDTIIFTLIVDPSDRGRVLGKQGKTIASLRAIFQSIATLHQRNAVINLRETEPGN